MSAVVRHLVAEKPRDAYDASGVLCVRGGDRKPKEMAPDARPLHAWTQDASKVTCPHCIEWMHA